MTKQKLKWGKIESNGYRPTVYAASIIKTRVDVHGMYFNAAEELRIIRENDGWRVDFAGNIHGVWLPWEPVSGKTYKSLAEAKRVAMKYANE